MTADRGRSYKYRYFKYLCAIRRRSIRPAAAPRGAPSQANIETAHMTANNVLNSGSDQPFHRIEGLDVEHVELSQRLLFYGSVGRNRTRDFFQRLVATR